MPDTQFTTVDNTGRGREKHLEGEFHFNRLQTTTMQASNQTLDDRKKSCSEWGHRIGGTSTCAVHVPARTQAMMRDEDCFHRKLTHQRLDYDGSCPAHNASTKSGTCTGN